ncbi:MAG: hypothetical protein IKB77_01420 [Lentisphaeria bacterium]|nr:hypothetical protein [Lentisphaeria bacterium]
MKIKFCLLMIALLYGFQNLNADVFLLRDFFKRRSSQQQNMPEKYRENQMLDILRFDSLFDEDISINGADGELHVGLLEFTYRDFLQALRYLGLKNYSANAVNTVIISGNQRYLIYNAGEFSKAVCFEFNVPYRKHPPPLPHFIPDPGGGAAHNRIIQFPDRGTTYVTFNMVYNAADAFYNCASQLQARGIKHIGSLNEETAAGFFMNDSGSEIVLVSFNQKYKNGFVYHTEKKK